MREATIILPTPVDAYNTHLHDVHDRLALDLAAAFHGYTVTDGHGGWINADGELIAEPVRIYTVAAAATWRDAHALRAIVGSVLDNAGEDAIYWRDFDGTVHIDTPTE